MKALFFDTPSKIVLPGSKTRRPSTQGNNLRITDPAAADEPRTLAQLGRYITKVFPLPLLGLEYFHEYLERYSAKGQMRKTSGVADQFPVRALYGHVEERAADKIVFSMN